MKGTMKTLFAIAVLLTCAAPLTAQEWIGHVGLGAGVPVNGFDDEVKGGVSGTIGVSRVIGDHFMLGAFYKYNRYSREEGSQKATLDLSSGSLQGRFLLRPASSNEVIPFVGVSVDGTNVAATVSNPTEVVRYTGDETLYGVTPTVGLMIPVGGIGYIEPTAAYQWRTTSSGDEIGSIDVGIGFGFAF